MPLMKEWVEITVDEDLLVPVVRELLDMAANPNHVEVVYGTVGRVILAEAHLAEHWYQERLKREATEGPSEEFEVVATGLEVVPVATPKPDPEPLVESIVAPAIQVSESPVKRGPGRPRKEPLPSASPDGEEN